MSEIPKHILKHHNNGRQCWEHSQEEESFLNQSNHDKRHQNSWYDMMSVHHDLTNQVCDGASVVQGVTNILAKINEEPTLGSLIDLIGNRINI
jgi:hypothetical protein